MKNLERPKNFYEIKKKFMVSWLNLWANR
jgi:hypothetical protein